MAITAHQWRHTYATSVINKGVRTEVIKQLLDHASLDMASHYARLLDTTIRAEWEAGQGPDQLPTDVDRGGLADAAWHNRARTALPNGRCGLPRQQTCDHPGRADSAQPVVRGMTVVDCDDPPALNPMTAQR